MRRTAAVPQLLWVWYLPIIACGNNIVSILFFSPYCQGITWQELVSVIAYAPFFVQRWYMVGVLLRVQKSQLDRISRSFLKHGNVNLACDEVLEAWLNGEIFYPETETEELADPRSWHTLHGVIVRMGERELAQRVYRAHLSKFYMIIMHWITSLLIIGVTAKLWDQKFRTSWHAKTKFSIKLRSDLHLVM